MRIFPRGFFILKHSDIVSVYAMHLLLRPSLDAQEQHPWEINVNFRECYLPHYGNCTYGHVFILCYFVSFPCPQGQYTIESILTIANSWGSAMSVFFTETVGLNMLKGSCTPNSAWHSGNTRLLNFAALICLS